LASRIDWAKEIDEKDIETEIENGYKKTTEYKYEDEKKYKVSGPAETSAGRTNQLTNSPLKITNIFKVDRVKLSRSIVERKVILLGFALARSSHSTLTHSRFIAIGEVRRRLRRSTGREPGNNHCGRRGAHAVPHQQRSEFRLSVTSRRSLCLPFSQKDTLKDNEPQAAQIPKIQCRLCKGDHWTTKCPLKDIYEKMNNMDMGKSEFRNRES
jgi:hypothetical protein